MKKPKPAPALAIEDVLGYVDACRITGNEDTIAAQIAAWAVSLHARNLELAAEVLPIETKRDAEIKALREQLAERDRQFYTPILDAAYAMNPARLQVCRMWVITARAAHRSDPTNTHAASYAAHVPDLLQTINTQAAENKALRERVEALEAAQRWVPVTERLPPPLDDETHSDWVQVAEADGDVSQAFLDWETGIWHNDGARLHVTHWQPLPTAPAGEGDGAK